MGIATFLGAEPVTSLRGLLWLALSDTGHVGTSSIASDAGGGGSATWTFGTAVPCRVDPLTGDEARSADRISDRSTHLITVPPGLQLTPSDRFQIDGRGTYEITAVRDRTSEPAGFVEVVQIS